MTVSLLEAISCRPGPKNLIQVGVKHVSARWVAACTRNLWEVHGAERLDGLEAPQGLLLVGNHRSYFDLYICGTYVTWRTRLMRRHYYPVRSSFFYDNPLGLLVNLCISGGGMWPPVFREPGRRRLNQTGIQQMAHVMGPGTVIGIHPEGRRNKSDDPYKLLPARSGVSKLLLLCHPGTVVLPFFILGLGNNLVHEIRRNFRPPGQRGEPIRIRFSEPVTAGELCAGRTAKQLVADVMGRIQEQAERDRESRRDA